MAKKSGAPKRASARRGEVRGRIQAKRRRSEYARRVDERIAGEIDQAVTAAAQVREQIIQKIERGLREGKGKEETVGAAVRRKRRQ